MLLVQWAVRSLSRAEPKSIICQLKKEREGGKGRGRERVRKKRGELSERKEG
jgi:hypothetical protein